MNFDNINQGDRYRIEIVSTIEYIPSMNYVDWTDPVHTSTTDEDVKQLSSLMKTALP